MTGNSNAKTVVHAITCFDTRTSIPAQPIVDSTLEVIHAGQIEEVEIGEIDTQVKFKTISTQGFLVRDFCTITGTTAETETDSILSISCKGQAHHSD